MGIIVREFPGGHVVAFEADQLLDVLHVADVSAQLSQHIGTLRAADVVIDFGNVRFLNSQALGMLLKLRRQATANGLRVHLAAIAAPLRRLFTISNLEIYFRIYDTVDAACLAFVEPAPPTGAPLGQDRPTSRPA